MTKTLIIVESPHKAKVIQGFLESKYIIKSSVGHISEMPLPNKMTDKEKEKFGDVAQTLTDFEPLFKTSKDKTKVVTELKKISKTVDEIILATDGDSEGAAIAWHLLQTLKPTVPTYRATWNEITSKAVNEGLKNKQLINIQKQTPKEFFNLAESAITRAQWDRLYGFKASSYMWRSLGPGLSAGRVQTPGTKLIVEREEKRLAFKSVSFYTILGVFEGNKSKLFELNGTKIADGSKINDDGEIAKGYLLITDKNVDSILKELKAKNYIIENVTNKPYRSSPPPPFTTSSGLQSIGSKTGFSAKQITSVFQNLYQNGIITYIRTVSVVAAPEAIVEARKEVEKIFGKKMLPAQSMVYKDKNAGNSGHECIRPVLDDNSGKLVNVKLTDAKNQKVFDLIRLRFLASQSIDCEGTTWTAIFSSKDNKAKFRSSETEIHEPGWTKIYQIDEEVGA